MLIIRQFQPEDMFSVIKLASGTLTEQYNPSLFNFFYETFPQGFIVAEKSHKIIGFILGVKINQDIAKILMLSVLEVYRKQNIGSELLNNFLKGMTTEKIKDIELEVRTDNQKAIKFYNKHNFKITRSIPKFYQGGQDAYSMKKIILES